MNPPDKEVQREAYPLFFKRLKLRHFQQLASALGLPTAATRSNIEVMISEKLSKALHDPTCVQVVVS